MNSEKIMETHWYPDKNLIVTHISGKVNKTDIETWEISLKNALAQIPENGSFRIFVNLHGFKAVDLEAHKRFRTIIPLILAEYGWKVGYLGLFEEEAGTISYSNTRGVKCTAAAHCHQDDTKIGLYESRYSRDNEHFFTDPEKARLWIENPEAGNHDVL